MMRSRIVIPTLLFLIVVIGQCTAFSSDKSADAHAALRKRSYPWYDASRDAFRRIEPEADPQSWNFDYNLPFAKYILWTLLGVVIALLLIGLFQWLRGLWPSVDTTHSTDTDTTQVSLERLEALPESARGVRDLLGEASRLASEGAYGMAMVFFHSWQLVELDKQQALELQKGKTNRRYLSEVTESRPDLKEIFRVSTRLFEDAFFGNLDVMREEFESVWNQRNLFTAKSRRPLS